LEIKNKEENLRKLMEEKDRVIEDRNIAEKINKKLKQAMEEYRVPEVLDYVKMNAELHDIKKKIKDWERKVEIAQMAYKKAKQEWHQSNNTSINFHTFSTMPSTLPTNYTNRITSIV
jgi:hypothetical protein